MTGLEPDRHVIVEIATVVTDDDLNVLGVGPDLVISASNDELAQMGRVVTDMHTGSGLLDRIRDSTTSRADAETATLNFLRDLGVPAGQVPLAGNSIGTDRRFLAHQMPALERYVHYRNVDVSTVKELAQRWRPDVLHRRPEKLSAHRAYDDIIESINELAFYRDHLFAAAPGSAGASL